MGNMIQAKVTVKGVRPMFWHAFGPDAIPLEKQERTGVAGHDPEEWRKTVLIEKSGQLYIYGTYVFSCLAGKSGSARYTKKGRSSLLYATRATLQVAEDHVLIDRWWPGYPNGQEFVVTEIDPPDTDAELPIYLDVRGGVNPTTRGRRVIYRIAACPGWLATFTLQWDKTIVSRDQMNAIMIDGGRYCGLGNGRSIGMGRFSVESFDVSELE